MPRPFLILSILLLALLTGCASLSPYPETPAVSVTSVQLLPGPTTASAPTIRLGLQVTNPNRAALPLAGMSYSLFINDQRLLSGATSDLPTVPAYGSANLTIDMTPDMLGGLRLLNQLSQAGGTTPMAARLDARLDLAGLRPALRISETLDLGR
ncbi:MAG: LEA type 2 family protein [Wenzhouxiangella sp.]